jgi:hypothetical protein
VIGLLTKNLWLTGLGAALVTGLAFSGGMTVQHLREAALRSDLKDDIIAFQEAAVEREGGRADAAERHAEAITTLSTAAMENFTQFLNAAGQGEAALAGFLEDLNNAPDTPDQPFCGYDDDSDRERWLRLFPAGAGDGLRAGDNRDRAPDTGQGP